LGHGVKNKFSFIQDYKFTIAFENSSVSGYTTEKLVDPMSVNSLPIYWGNPDVNLDFNINSILHLKNENQIEEIIAQIIYLDTNDVAYSKKLKEPWLKNNLTLETWIEKLDIFLHNIFKTSSRRITTYGYNSFYFTEQKFASRFLDFPIIRKIVKNI
ncbi:MAG: glycosyltransferase family 10, partial [Tannerellaceae bacterium]|nr:glycosyltransferase family 10 [Tannerellaceae bacterium]